MAAKVLIKAFDNNVPQSGGRWLRGEPVAVVDSTATLGNGELNIANFYRYTVTDAEPPALQQYLETYNREQNSVVLAGPTTQFTFTSLNMNVSETLGEWTVPLTVDLLDRWNTANPTELLSTDSVTNAVWTCSGTLSAPSALEFETLVLGWGLSDMLKRKIWYVTPAGMTSIQGQGGIESGTLAQLQAILQDARLD
jgi:hypothetical protein